MTDGKHKEIESIKADISSLKAFNQASEQIGNTVNKPPNGEQHGCGVESAACSNLFTN